MFQVGGNKPFEALLQPKNNSHSSPARFGHTLAQDTVHFSGDKNTESSSEPPQDDSSSNDKPNLLELYLVQWQYLLNKPSGGAKSLIAPIILALGLLGAGTIATRPNANQPQPTPPGEVESIVADEDEPDPAEGYKTGEIVSPQVVLQLGKAEKLKRVDFVTDPSSSIIPYYEIVLQNGVVLMMSELESPQANQDFIEAMRSDYGVSVNQITHQESNLLPTMLNFLLFGSMLFFGFKILSGVMKGQGGGMGQIPGTNGAHDYVENEKTRFSDVKGHDEVINELAELVELARIHAVDSSQPPPPQGVLMVGPPGTGKTLLAKAVAGEAGLPFFSIAGSDFVEMYVGVGARRVRDLFEQAKKHAPSIIFIDEIDAVGRTRISGPSSGDGTAEDEKTLTALLKEMDGFEKETGVIVLAATNREDVLDRALVRRFSKVITVDPPRAWEDRYEILKVHVEKQGLVLDHSVDLKLIAKDTVGHTGATLAKIVEDAKHLAARDNRFRVSDQDFAEAQERQEVGIRKPLKESQQEQRRLTAIHEMGHAFIAKSIQAAIHRISTVPAGESLGHVSVDESNMFGEGAYTRKELLNRLLLSLGGHASEKVHIGDENVTTGAGGDWQQFERLFRAMRTYALLGESPEDYSDPRKPLTPDDKELQQILFQESMKVCMDIVRQIPPEEFSEIIKATLAYGEKGQVLVGPQRIDNFFEQMLGKDFDWSPLHQIADDFVAQVSKDPAMKAWMEQAVQDIQGTGTDSAAA